MILILMGIQEVLRLIGMIQNSDIINGRANDLSWSSIDNLSSVNQQTISQKDLLVLLSLVQSGILRISSNGELQLQSPISQNNSELSQLLAKLSSGSKTTSNLSHQAIAALLQNPLDRGFWIRRT